MLDALLSDQTIEVWFPIGSLIVLVVFGLSVLYGVLGRENVEG